MKTFKYIALMIGVSLFSSCDSLLDEDPKYSLDSSSTFATEQSAKMALDGCYGYLTTGDVYGQSYTELTVGASGITWCGTGGSDQDDHVSLRARLADGAAQTTWAGLYRVVNETNSYIKFIGSSSLSENIKTKMGAEAKFLRALAYFHLATIWGDIPFKTDPSQTDNVNLSRTPKATVFAQCESDWQYAFDHLPESSTDGYATKWAAKALLGKLYYTLAGQGDQDAWAKAKTCFDAVYGKYALQPKFGDLFVNNVTGSKESIFQLNYSTTSAFNKSRLHWIFSPRDSGVGVSWARVTSTKSFYDKFRTTYPGDPRLEATFFKSWRKYSNNVPAAQVFPAKPTANDSGYCYPYYSYATEEKLMNNKGQMVKVSAEDCMPYDKLADSSNPGYDELSSGTIPNGKRVIENFANKTRLTAYNSHWPILKKYYDPIQVGQNSHKNLFVYRYGELLIDMADVYNESGNTVKAISLINEVLLRARQSSPGATQPADWNNSLSKEVVREKIYLERLFETFGEPGQYQRVRVRGTEYDLFKNLLEINNNHSITRKVVEFGDGKVAWGDRLFNGNDGLTPDFMKKNLLLPINEKELNTNPAIKRSENNFGYGN